MPVPLVPFDRSRALAAMAEECFDVVIVGGGVTGCGVALDAASRGFKTALVEAGDFASGTSSKSSKLAHGGLRYLQQHEFHLVAESLAERQHLLRNAPHLVRPLPFLIPLFGGGGVVSSGVAKQYSIALWIYDLSGGVRIGHPHRRLSREEAIRHFSGLRTERLVAAFLYWDAQVDDARLTLALARTAVERHGAVAANYAPATDILTNAGGRVQGVLLEDGTPIRGRVVVNCGGVWGEKISSLHGHHGPAIRLRPAKGVHITVPANRLPCDFASVIPVPGDRRTIFVVPWDAAGAEPSGGVGRYTYIGTTDTDYSGPLDHPHCSHGDIEYLLSAVNAATTADLAFSDVTGTWAGLRPLVQDTRSKKTADLSRKHKVIASSEGLVTVTGGKLTTYRRMASDTVDEVARLLGQYNRCSRTRSLGLVGAGASSNEPDRLERRYGSEAARVRDLYRADPTLAEPLVAGQDFVRAEAVFAARHEMAVTPSDVLARRTRAWILDRSATLDAVGRTARLMAEELGWSSEEEARQAEGCRVQLLEEEKAASEVDASPGRLRRESALIAR